MSGSLRRVRCGRIDDVARAQSKPIGQPDEVRRFPFGALEIYNIDDLVFGRTVFQPGWRWSEHVKPIAGTERCQYHHVGYTISGRLRVVMADGSQIDMTPDAVYEIPPGHDAWVLGDEPYISINVAGMRSFARVDEGAQRILGAILLTDIVDSTAIAERLGATAWKELLTSHREDVQFQLDRFRGRLVKSTGDGFLAYFVGCERAVRAAAAIVDGGAARGIEIRAGVHTREVELAAGDLHGLSVHFAARVMAAAAPGRVYVSATTHELVAGAGLAFEDAGIHELKGISGPRQLFALVHGGS
jgi:class 3 adenylate cyclase